MTKNGSFNSAV